MARHNVKCPVCGKVFTVTNLTNKYCSDECAYVGTYLTRPAAKLMSPEEAITHYRMMYRDTILRGVGRSKYIPVLRHISEFCKVHGRDTFTCEEVAEGAPDKLVPTTLGAIGRRHDKIVQVELTGSPGVPTVWRFTMPRVKQFRKSHGL